MIRIWTVLAAALALLVAGCASDAERRLEQNEKAFASGDYLTAYRNMVDTHAGAAPTGSAPPTRRCWPGTRSSALRSRPI